MKKPREILTRKHPTSADLSRILAAHFGSAFSTLYLTVEDAEQPGPHWQTLGDKLMNWAKGVPVPDPFPPHTISGPVIW